MRLHRQANPSRLSKRARASWAAFEFVSVRVTVVLDIATSALPTIDCSSAVPKVSIGRGAPRTGLFAGPDQFEF
jgi:hypothetical protein